MRKISKKIFFALHSAGNDKILIILSGSEVSQLVSCHTKHCEKSQRRDILVFAKPQYDNVAQNDKIKFTSTFKFLSY
ncbi:hypothetical protein [Campylobacter troglodytis]|uniref:hypothetical protein n=1 Tax=Campylobacter troglodytis TaxID=654363 RepID=UPI0011571EF7|nr:hypothetical protein [Campylobacter troglodytis]